MDKMTKNNYSEEVYAMYHEYLRIAGLNVPVKNQLRADHLNPAVKKADRIAFYIGALKFKGNVAKWPFLEKRIYIARLPELILPLNHPKFFEKDKNHSVTSSFDIS